jgi:hypothetical protein
VPHRQRLPPCYGLLSSCEAWHTHPTDDALLGLLRSAAAGCNLELK